MPESWCYQRNFSVCYISCQSCHQNLWFSGQAPVVKTATKVKVYNAAILPTLLYSTECMSLYRRRIKKLTRTQLRHLCQILGIHWQDRAPDVEVLRRANTPNTEALNTASQLRWAGHVACMSDSRLPKAVLYRELTQGKRKQGGQKLRFKGVLKRHMKNIEICPDSWEEAASSRRMRRPIGCIEEKCLVEYQRAHERRHTLALSTWHAYCICGRLCRSNAGLAAHQRKCTDNPSV